MKSNCPYCDKWFNVNSINLHILKDCEKVGWTFPYIESPVKEHQEDE